MENFVLFIPVQNTFLSTTWYNPVNTSVSSGTLFYKGRKMQLLKTKQTNKKTI
jgi:hypothetical protein